MRRVVYLLLFLTMSTLFFVNIVGAQKTSEIEVFFSDNSAFTEDEKEIITSHICGIERSTGTGEGMNNIICSIFGHSYGEWEIITAIKHKVYSSAPRCEEENYKVRICSRCSNTETVRLSIMRIYCCD